MRCLNTGYAVEFNRRHLRSGYLFQNRFKSILVEEEPYLLELVRYIHLNPFGPRSSLGWSNSTTTRGPAIRRWLGTSSDLAGERDRVGAVCAPEQPARNVTADSSRKAWDMVDGQSSWGPLRRSRRGWPERTETFEAVICGIR